MSSPIDYPAYLQSEFSTQTPPISSTGRAWTKLAIAIIQATTAMVNLMSILIEFLGFSTKVTEKKGEIFSIRNKLRLQDFSFFHHPLPPLVHVRLLIMAIRVFKRGL